MQLYKDFWIKRLCEVVMISYYTHFTDEKTEVM